MSDKREALAIPEEVREHPAWFRLDDQLDWYDSKSVTNHKRYTWIKTAQLALAASVPVFALVGGFWTRLIAAVLGAGIAVLEGVQQLGQYHDLWINYRSTAEHLKHEKYLFLAASGPYRDLETRDALKLLAERVEEQVSTEHARWISEAEQAGQQKQN